MMGPTSLWSAVFPDVILVLSPWQIYIAYPWLIYGVGSAHLFDMLLVFMWQGMEHIHWLGRACVGVWIAIVICVTGYRTCPLSAGGAVQVFKCYWYLSVRLWNTSASCEWHCTGVWYVIGIYVAGYGTHPLPVSGTVQVFDMLLVFMWQAMEHIHYLWVGLYRCLICYWYLCDRLWNTSTTCEWRCRGVWYVIGLYVTGYGTHPLPVSGAMQVFDMLLVFMWQVMEYIHYLWVALYWCLMCNTIYVTGYGTCPLPVGRASTGGDSDVPVVSWSWHCWLAVSGCDGCGCCSSHSTGSGSLQTEVSCYDNKGWNQVWMYLVLSFKTGYDQLGVAFS